MSDNVEVGRGLNRIFIGQLLVIVAMILAIIPPAGLFAVVAALVLPMMGLYQAGRWIRAITRPLCSLLWPGCRGCCAGRSGSRICSVISSNSRWSTWSAPRPPDGWRRKGTCPRQPGGGLCGNSMRPAWRSRSSPASLCQSWARGWLASCWVTLVAALANAVFYMTFLYRASKRLQE